MALPEGMRDTVVRRTLAWLAGGNSTGDVLAWTRTLREQMDPQNTQYSIDFYNTVRAVERMYDTARGFGLVNERVGPVRSYPFDRTAMNSGWQLRARVVVTTVFDDGTSVQQLVVVDFNRPATSDEVRNLAIAQAQRSRSTGNVPAPPRHRPSITESSAVFLSLGRSTE